MEELILGAVAYDPKVVTIWDGFRAWLAARDLPLDYILYTSYERQVDAHLRGEIDVAWNSPLAWVQAQREATSAGRRAHAIAMRDTDRDLTSVIVVRADSSIQTLADLRGTKVAVGAADSPQATLIPLLACAEAGVEPGRDFEVLRHDLLLGKHGDHVGGEHEAMKALMAGTADAACILDGNRLAFTRSGLITANTTRVLQQTHPYDHCNMTVLDDLTPELARFTELLLGMSHSDPTARPLLDLEGLRQWLPGRTSGYALLERAVARFAPLPSWLGG